MEYYSMDVKSSLMGNKATLLLLRARSYRGCFKPNRLHGTWGGLGADVGGDKASVELVELVKMDTMGDHDDDQGSSLSARTRRKRKQCLLSFETKLREKKNLGVKQEENLKLNSDRLLAKSSCYKMCSHSIQLALGEHRRGYGWDCIVGNPGQAWKAASPRGDPICQASGSLLSFYGLIVHIGDICRSLFVCLKVVHYSGWENTIADEWEAESLCWRPSKEQLLSEYMIAKLLKKKPKNFTFFSDSVADGKIKSPDPQLKKQKVQRRASSPCTKGIIFRSATIHQVLKWH